MSKKIIISLDGPASLLSGEGHPNLFRNEYPHIYLDHEITHEELLHSYDVITTYFMQNNIYRVEVDLNQRDMSLAPPVEMTIEEIEKKLGHKIKVVGNKEEK